MQNTCWSLNLGTCVCDLIWKQGLGRWNQVKVRSHWIRVGSNPVTAVLIRRGKFGWTHRVKGHVTAEAETGTRHPQAKEAKNCQQHQKPWEMPGEFFPLQLPEGTSPANIWISDFWPPEWWENQYLSFLRQQECGDVLQQLWGTNASPESVMPYKEPGVGWCSLHPRANEVRGTASASHGGTVFRDGARPSPGTLLGLQRPPWLCPKQRGISEGTCEAWGSAWAAQPQSWGLAHMFRSQDLLGLGEGRSLWLFFLFCFFWDCTEVCGELDLFVGWGVLNF